jgi:flagellar FliJ protein
MYKFNLQSVLDHRQLTEDSLKRELAEIQRHRQAARQQLEALEEREKHTMALLKQEQAEGISSDGVVGFHAYLARLSQQIIKQKMALCDLQQKESAKLNELGEALKKRKILEKLKDQGLRRYQRMIVKEEMQYIDEVAVNRYVRRCMAKNGNGK